VVGVADLPTRFGNFRIVAFWNNRDAKEHIAVVHGDVLDREDVATRLHSECLTGDALGSLRCDCRDQLEVALRALGAMERGCLLYLRQEGRGIGLINKVRAYALQDAGLDTVEANLALGFRDDERDYAIAAHMLKSLAIRSVRLMTNNPTKIRQLTQYGLRVSGRIPLVIPSNPFNRFYLETKANRSGHFIDLAGKIRLPEQSDPVVVEGMPTDAQG
jgi:GTP cyclohydrolase II